MERPRFLNSTEKFDKLISSVEYDKTSVPPVNPSENGVHLVDKGDLGHDWKHTSSSWKNISTSFNIFFNEDRDIDTYTSRHVVKKDIKTTIQSLGLSCGYIMRTTYYRHYGNNSVKRNITEVDKIQKESDCESEVALVATNYALIEYIFPKDVVSLSPHKRNNKYFIPTAPSVKSKIKEAVKSNAGPRTINAGVSGSLLENTVPGTTPRNEKQISYYRNRLKQTTKTKDEFQEILNFSRHDEIGRNFIHNLQFPLKGIRFVVAMTPQIDEIVKYCTKITDRCGILSIDTTFNVGQFFMTPTSYPLPSVINKRTNKPVNMPGPCLFHVEEENHDVYLYFAHSLIQMNTEIDKVRYIGGDRGKGQRGFMYPMRSSVLLPCTRHMQSNIEQHLKDSPLRRQIFKDLFGSQTEMLQGLVDCERRHFDHNLNELVKKWPDEFVEYFRTNIEHDMKEGMLKDVRNAVGLGSELFYNNALECLNKKIKNKKREMQAMEGKGANVKKMCTLMEAVTIYKNILYEERKFLHQAVIGKGPYVLSPDYEENYIDEVKFCKLSLDEKRNVLSKIDPFVNDSDVSADLLLT